MVVRRLFGQGLIISWLWISTILEVNPLPRNITSQVLCAVFTNANQQQTLSAYRSISKLRKQNAMKLSANNGCILSSLPRLLVRVRRRWKLSFFWVFGQRFKYCHADRSWPRILGSRNFSHIAWFRWRCCDPLCFTAAPERLPLYLQYSEVTTVETQWVKTTDMAKGDFVEEIIFRAKWECNYDADDFLTSFSESYERSQVYALIRITAK